MAITDRKLEELIQLQEMGYDISEINVELKEQIEKQEFVIPCVESEIIGYLLNDYLNKLIYYKMLQNDRISPQKAERLVKLELAKKFKTHSTRLNKYLEYCAKVIAIYCKKHHWKYVNEKTIEIMLENIAHNIAMFKSMKKL